MWYRFPPMIYMLRLSHPLGGMRLIPTHGLHTNPVHHLGGMRLIPTHGLHTTPVPSSWRYEVDSHQWFTCYAGSVLLKVWGRFPPMVYMIHRSHPLEGVRLIPTHGLHTTPVQSSGRCEVDSHPWFTCYAGSVLLKVWGRFPPMVYMLRRFRPLEGVRLIPSHGLHTTPVPSSWRCEVDSHPWFTWYTVPILLKSWVRLPSVSRCPRYNYIW